MYLKESLTFRCIAVFCACVLLLTAADLLIPGDEALVFTNLIRLHVVADGDGDEEQRVKFLVRDAILAEYGGLFSDCSDSSEAIKTAYENLDAIKSTADRVLAENGADYKAAVGFGREVYPERDYGGMSLPSGEYYSLRVKLGSASGKNWWCVMFPPLCFGVGGNGLSKAGINEKSAKVFTSKRYIFRFRILEWFR
ncbi:MAG: stage II sporulation protein R [Clostridia bacterium]|nr:stage II sporulation protein R [Clostridia bacterium]